MKLVKVKIYCPKCTRVQGKWPWEFLFWVGIWYWVKVNLDRTFKRRKYRVEHLCRRCKHRITPY